MTAFKVIDSITELQPADAGCIALSGSHGGLSSAHYAIAVRPWLSVFNDAGVGRQDAGIAGLDALQSAGLAALTVSHTSACIGQAASTLRDGIVSYCNPQALALGFETGKPLADQLDAITTTRRKP